MQFFIVLRTCGKINRFYKPHTHKKTKNKTKQEQVSLVKPIGSFKVNFIFDGYTYSKDIIKLQKCSSSVGSPTTQPD